MVKTVVIVVVVVFYYVQRDKSTHTGQIMMRLSVFGCVQRTRTRCVTWWSTRLPHRSACISNKACTQTLPEIRRYTATIACLPI